VIPWHETAHLALDHAGDLWLWETVGGRRRLKWLGPVVEWPEVPEGLEAERAECWDLWADQDVKLSALWHGFFASKIYII
jgi:hypothetical protein